MKNTVFLFLVISSKLLFGQIPNEISNQDKVFGLSKFWQEVNYNFVYLDKVDRTEWDKQYKELITEVQNTSNDYEYYRLLQKFCAFLKDGHTNIWFPQQIQDNIYNTNFGDYRLFLSNINGKAIITRVNKSKKDEIPIGTEIVEVNGLDTKAYLNKNVLPYISSSTDFILEDWGIESLLEGYVGTSYDLKLKLPNGKIKLLTVKHQKTLEQEVFPPLENRELMDLKWMGKQKEIAYVSLNSFSDWKISMQFKEKINEIKKAKAIIIDLRYNTGGNTGIGKEIFKHLTNDSILYGSKSVSRNHIPTYKAWGKFQTEKDAINSDWSRKSLLSYQDKFYYEFPYQADTISKDDLRLLKDTRLVVPTVVLIGHNTASAAEDFLIYADNQKHFTKIGEPTFGSTGQPFMFDLPNGGSARVCTKKDTYPNGKEFVGVGIQPDVFVAKILQDFIENKDPVLQKAVDYLSQKK